MKCLECEKYGKVSYVYEGPSFRTAMNDCRFYDKDGNFHCHDWNTTSTLYSCSNGHQWSKQFKKKCPTCNFNENPGIAGEKSEAGCLSF
jgi:hypothetical protein